MSTINEDNDYRAKKFLEKALDEHYAKHGVYFDTVSKISEVMELYAIEEFKRKTQ